MSAAAKEVDPFERAFYAGKHCTAAWNGDIAHFEAIGVNGTAADSVADTGYWMVDATDETKGRSALVYIQDTKRYALVNVMEIETCDHEMRLEPLFYACANGKAEVVRWFSDWCSNPSKRPNLRKILDTPQYVTCVRLDKPLQPAGTNKLNAANGTNGHTTTTAAAAAVEPGPAPNGQRAKYVLVLEGSASKPVTPLQVAILNGHNECAMLLQLDSPGGCRGCEASDCTIQ